MYGCVGADRGCFVGWSARQWRKGCAADEAVAVPEHRRTLIKSAEGSVQAVCSCGWRSAVLGEDKSTGTMDPLQRAIEAADLQDWETELS